MPTNKQINEFLTESNAIEGVYGEDPLRQALFAWHNLQRHKTITPGIVLATHKILMLHQPLLPHERGYFRTISVWIGGKEAPDARTIKKQMEAWSEMMNTKGKRDWKYLHVAYEKIHPFVDGNGRTGRMFMNWHRLKVGMKLLTIHAGEEQQTYYKWFKDKK